MTTLRRDSGGSPFGDWLRQNPDLDSVGHLISATDVDMWIHKYTPRAERKRKDNELDYLDLLMLVEVKTFSSEAPYAQRDTLQLAEQLFRKGTVKGSRRRVVNVKETRISHLLKTKRPVRWYGIHLLQLSSDRPDTSDQILWDKKPISLDALIGLLRFEFDPDHPTKRIDTRRHHIVKSLNEDLPLLRLIKK